jgi:hypothetical protein
LIFTLIANSRRAALPPTHANTATGSSALLQVADELLRH